MAVECFVSDIHPKSGVDYPATYQDLLTWFPDDASCLDYLAQLRWPKGFVCPGCGSTDFWRTGNYRPLTATSSNRRKNSLKLTVV